MRVMFVDPGISGTGWAFWESFHSMRVNLANTEKHAYAVDFIPALDLCPEEICSTPPTISGSILPIAAWKRTGWIGVACSIATQMQQKFIEYDIEYLGIENPELWSGSATSHAAAARGNLGKLSFLIGCLAKTFEDTATQLPCLFPPRTWKGQLPKEAIVNRIKRFWPHISPRNHESDAIGMGLYFLGGL